MGFVATPQAVQTVVSAKPDSKLFLFMWRGWSHVQLESSSGNYHRHLSDISSALIKISSSLSGCLYSGW